MHYDNQNTPHHNNEKEERLQIKDCWADTAKIQESVQKGPHLIECGIFKLETMPYTPFAK